MPDKPLDEQIALVTGASRGIGQAIAAALGAAGATVIGTATSQGGADNISAALATAGVRGTGMVLDVADAQSVSDCLKQVSDEFGAPDILVNNAGIMLAPHTVTPDLIERTFATNYIGPFLLTNLLLPLLESSSSQPFPSRVVNVGSEAHRWTPAGKTAHDKQRIRV